MKTIITTLILICSTVAHATDFFLNKGVDGWTCMDRGQYYPVTVENGAIHVNVGASEYYNGDKCHPQDAYGLDNKYGLTATVTCTATSFTVRLTQGKAVLVEIDPMDIKDGVYFTVVMRNPPAPQEPTTNPGGATKKAQPTKRELFGHPKG